MNLLSFSMFNHLKPNSPVCYTLPYRPNLPFFISDIRHNFGQWESFWGLGESNPKDVPFVNEFWWGTYDLGAISPRKQHRRLAHDLTSRFNVTRQHSGPERQSARMSEIKNGMLGLYGAEHAKCNHTMKLGFKGLTR